MRARVARPETHRPAAICDDFGGRDNILPPENMHEYHCSYGTASFKFFHARPAPDLEREEGVLRTQSPKISQAGLCKNVDKFELDPILRLFGP